MENNKKKKLINSVLAGVLGVGAIGTTAAVLSSCNISLSAGDGTSPEEDNIGGTTGKPNKPGAKPEKLDGFSSFITDRTKNDYKVLEDAKQFEVFPQQADVNYPGASEKLKYSKNYVIGTKQYKDKVNECKARLTSIAKNLVVNAVENSLAPNWRNELYPFVNISERNGKLSVVYNLVYVYPTEWPDSTPPEGVEPETPELEIPEVYGDTTKDYLNAMRRFKNKVENQPERDRQFLAFKYDFDFSNAKFEINDNSSLVAKGITWSGKLDFNNKIQELPSDVRLEDINNQIKFFNIHFPYLFHGNPEQKIMDWNKARNGNQNFLNIIADKFKASAQKRVDKFKDVVGTIYDIFTELRTNDPTIRSFIFYLEPTISKIAESMNLHPALRTTIKDVLNPNLQLGDPKDPAVGTLYYDINKLKEAGIINGTVEKVLNKFILPKLKNTHPVDYVLELPNTMSKMDQKAINAIMFAIKIISKDLHQKIVKMGKKIDFVYQIFKNLMERAPTVEVNGKPEHRIGEIKVLDLFSTDNMYGFWDYLINTLVPVLVKDQQKAQKIIKTKNDLKPVLKQVKYNKNTLKTILEDFTNVYYKGKSWKKPKRKTIVQFLKDNTTFDVASNTITPNTDGQSFNVNLAYRLNFNLEVRISLKQFNDMFEPVKIVELAKALGINKIPEGLEGLVNWIGNLGKAFAENIHIMPGDYIEYRIEDPKAFIIPTQNGYSIKAKQYFKTSFQSSLDETYNSLKNRYKMWWWLVKKIANPIYYTLRNYYAASSYSTTLNDTFVDSNNSFDLTQGVFDGKVIDNSPANLESIRKNIVVPFVSVKENLQNSNKEFTLELQGDIKNRILKQLGLDPNVYGNKSKFILTSNPGFAIKVKAGKLPTMSGITLDISFNTPILQKDSAPPVWVNEIKFTNL